MIYKIGQSVVAIEGLGEYWKKGETLIISNIRKHPDKPELDEIYYRSNRSYAGFLYYYNAIRFWKPVNSSKSHLPDFL